MLCVYLSQSNDVSDLLLDAEVGGWKVAAAWVCIGISCVTSVRKTEKSTT